MVPWYVSPYPRARLFNYLGNSEWEIELRLTSFKYTCYLSNLWERKTKLSLPAILKTVFVA